MSLRRSFLVLIVSLSFVSCSSKHSAKTTYLESESAQISISSSEPPASEAGARIIREGGNIADAAVATIFTTFVVRPWGLGVAGGGFLLYYDPQTKKTEAWDFREVAPLQAKADMYLQNGEVVPDLSLRGAKAVAVPGAVAGLFDFQKAHGKLPWAQVLKPAIEYAENGAPVTDLLHKYSTQYLDVLSKDPEMSKVFTRNGKALPVGESFVQKDLAKTLRGIADGGKDYFYRGDFAKTLAKWMKENGGIITEQDLHRYRVKKRDALEASWKNLKVISMPPPSSGGIHLIQILKIVDGISSDFVNSFQTQKDSTGVPVGPIVANIEAFKRAFADRAFNLGDPDFFSVPVQKLLSEKYLKKRADEISESKTIQPSEKIVPFAGKKNVSTQTAHFSLMDSEGRTISSTVTHNFFFGAGVILPGTGVILNDEMDDFSTPGVANVWGLVGNKGNAIGPGKRPLSSMTPAIFVDASTGKAKMAIGAAGGPKIITMVYLVASKILRDRIKPEVAIGECRYHHQWMPDKVQIEDKCFKDFQALKPYYSLEKSDFPGEVAVVGVDDQGKMYSLTDPRGHGKALLWPSSTSSSK